MKTKQLLKSMKVVSWVIFIGICIKAGAILIAYGVSLFIEPQAAKDIYQGLNLSALYDFNAMYYHSFLLILLALLMVQAYLFFLVIRLFSNFNEQYPFSHAASKLIGDIANVSLLVGIVALFGSALCKWFTKRGVEFYYDWSAKEFLLMAAVVFTISLFFKRGVEIQSENELTI